MFNSKEYYKNNKKRMIKSILESTKKRLYGISGIEYNKILEQQNNVCAICQKKEKHKQNKRIRKMSIDHDHETGKVRGLLCHHCNIMLGFIKDDIIILKNAIKYLSTNKK